MINIFAGNLAYAVTEEDLREAFSAHGQVSRASLITDKLTGRSRGFGFVEMADDAEAKAAMEALHEKELKGRKMLIREAHPRGERVSRPDYRER